MNKIQQIRFALQDAHNRSRILDHQFQYTEALAALSDLEKEQSWQGMDSAKKDNRYIIGYALTDSETGNWNMDMIVWDENGQEWHGWPRHTEQPTHWKNLPSPPEGE